MNWPISHETLHHEPLRNAPLPVAVTVMSFLPGPAMRAGISTIILNSEESSLSFSACYAPG